MLKIFEKQATDYLILLAILCISFWQLVFGIATMKWDVMDIYLPWKYFTTECLRNGMLPLWNPFINSGFAQYGDINTWYPVSWIISLFHRYNVSSVHFEYLLHVYIAGIGFYKISQQNGFTRITRLIVATAYMLSGLFISNAQHTGWIISAAWLPFCFYYFIKIKNNSTYFDGIKLGICLFLMLTGGYPGIFISLIYLLLCFFLYYLVKFFQTRDFQKMYSWIFSLGISGFIFLSLSAVAIAGTLDISEYITRGKGLPFDHSHWGILTGSLPPKALITFLFPYAASINDLNFWGEDFSILNCYLGFIPLLTLPYALLNSSYSSKYKFYIFLGFMFLAISMADIFPFRKWMYVLLPGMNLFRFSSLFRLFSIFFFLISSGFILDEWRKIKFQSKYFLITISTFLIIIFIIWVILFFNIQKWQFFLILKEGLSKFDSIAGISEKSFFQSSILLALILTVLCLLRFRFKYYFVILGLIGCLDMVIATQLNFYSTIACKFPPKQVDEAFAKLPMGFPLPALTAPMNQTNTESFKGKIPYLWQNLAGYFKTPSYDGSSPYSFYNEQNALKNKTFQSAINHPLLFIAGTPSVNGVIDTTTIDDESSKKISIKRFNSNYLMVNITTTQNKSLVFLQNYYPCWNASINGIPTSIIKTNDMFMSIGLKEGYNRVVFSFQPKKIIGAFYISLCSFLILLTFYIYQLIKILKISVRIKRLFFKKKPDFNSSIFNQF